MTDQEWRRAIVAVIAEIRNTFTYKGSPIWERIDGLLEPLRAEQGQKKEDSLNDIAKKAMNACAGQREEILRAFIAKYQCEPDEVEQVERRTDDGRTIWTVRWKLPEQKKKQDFREELDLLHTSLGSPSAYQCDELIKKVIHLLEAREKGER